MSLTRFAALEITFGGFLATPDSIGLVWVSSGSTDPLALPARVPQGGRSLQRQEPAALGAPRTWEWGEEPGAEQQPHSSPGFLLRSSPPSGLSNIPVTMD